MSVNSPVIEVSEIYQVCAFSEQLQRPPRGEMKPDARKMFVIVLGIIEIALGCLFLCVGTWSILKARQILLMTGCLPFPMAILSIIGGFLAIYGPRRKSQKMIFFVIIMATFTSLLTMTLVVWMFFTLLKSSSMSMETSYKSFLMGLNLLLMLNSGIIASSTWTIRESLVRRRRHRRNGIRDEPPPAYFPNRMMYLNENFPLPTTSINTAPPPYEP